ncbi:V-set and immunoglobulin domain-containing protein 10-like [Bagarius yarrelli]|nr:V-set and immunoglobulin domain-containing protein 10-like [Bagarius yarrelli]
MNSFCVPKVGSDSFLSVWPDEPTLVTAFVGTNLTLGFSYSGAPDPLVTWLNGTLTLATWTVGHTTPPDIAPAHSKVLSIDQTGSLVFQNVSVSYNGTYTVQISKPGAHEASANFTLLVYNVITDPSVFTASQDVVEGGASFTLSYGFTQGPVTTSTWYFKGSEVVNSSRYLITKNSLILHQPNRSDTGLYSVVLTNPFSNVIQSKNVTVLYGPDQPILEVSPTKATFVPGETVSLRCRAEGEPTPTASWVFNGQELLCYNGTLQLPRVETSQSGVYTCVLVNGRTNARLMRNVTINIQAANQSPRYPVTQAVKKAVISQPDLRKPHRLLANGLKQPPAYDHHRHQVLISTLARERSGTLPLGIPPVRMATTV